MARPEPHPAAQRVSWRAVGVLLAATACLALEAAMRSGQIPEVLPWRTEYVPQHSLLPYFVVPFVLLPLLGHNPIDYFGLGRFRQVWAVFAVLLAVIVATSAWLASLDSVRMYYASESAGRLAPFLRQTALTIACVEFFFRGFLLLPLFADLGWYALPIATMPYCLIHTGKPLIEVYGSIPFGLALSYLAVRSGSILYGLLLHWLLAIAVPWWVALSR